METLDNQQLQNLTNEQLQIFLSGRFGDGRQYWYLRVGKYKGAAEISKILQKYPVNCYNYKVWSSETIQKWSKLQEQLKSQGKDYLNMNGYSLSCMLKKISL